MKKQPKDRLEEFVKNNKNEFDTEVPSAEVWDGIQKNVFQVKQKTSIEMWVWRVAAMIFLCSSVVLWSTQLNTDKEQQATEAVLSGDFNRIEKFYFSQISEKQDQIINYQTKKDINGNYDIDLQKLDAMYEVLKGELNKNPKSKEVKDALTLNLLIRIDLLNEQLKGLEDSKKEEHVKEYGV